MSKVTLPAVLEDALSQNEPEAVFAALLPGVCEVLQTDRCFIHLRNPETRMYRNIAWRRESSMPDTSTDGWVKEDEWEKEDPMFAAALRVAPAIFVDDIETASSDVLNVEFERTYMKHRCLVHAHIGENGVLWGILQPCLFSQPKGWSESDRAIINELTTRLLPIVQNAVKAAGV